MKKTLAKVLALALCAVLLVTGTVFVTLAYLQANTGVVKNAFTSAGVLIRLNETKVNVEGKPVAADNKTLLTDPNTYIREEQMGNTYELIPGSTYMKDPKVFVEGKSVPCYIYIAILDTMFDSGNAEGYVNGAWVPSEKEKEFLDYSTNDGRKGSISQQLYDNGWRKVEGIITDEDVMGTLVKENGAWSNDTYTVYVFTEANSGIDGAQDGWITPPYNEETDEYEEVALPLFDEFTISYEAKELNANDKVLQIIAFGVQSQGFEATGEQTAAQVAWDSTYGAPPSGEGT